MDEKLKDVIRAYLKEHGYDTSDEKVDDLVDEYESRQTFTELKDGRFEMITGNTPDEVTEWLNHLSLYKSDK